jgi:cation transport protein ChaC
MCRDDDPFRHHPELREQIADPLTSVHRSMDLASLDQRMLAAGAAPNWRHSDAHRERSRNETLNGRWDGGLWIFAYGSLMWDPAIRFSEVRTALLRGYHRSFCLRSVISRGTPECPGLMAGLDGGGECNGLVFKIDQHHVEEETRVIWNREMLLHAYTPAFVRIETFLGDVEALTFVVDHEADSYLSDLSDEEAVRYVATGVGNAGSSLAYIESLAEHFETLGIEDAALFHLYEGARRLADR